MEKNGLQQKPLDQRVGMVISNPNYRRLWGIGLLSRTMHWLETVALGIFVFELTGSPFWVGVVGFLRLVPMFIFGPVVGLIADIITQTHKPPSHLRVLGQTRLILVA